MSLQTIKREIRLLARYVDPEKKGLAWRDGDTYTFNKYNFKGEKALMKYASENGYTSLVIMRWQT